MDKELFNEAYSKAPQFNPILAEGLATSHLPRAPHYIDKVFKCAQPDFPAELKYKGWEICPPEEAYAEIVRRRKNKRQFETAPSDVYMVKYNMEWNGVPLPPRYQFMPIVSHGGLMRIRGPLYAVYPVLTDKAISVGVDNIFIPLTRAKLKFERTMWHYSKCTDGREFNRASEYVIHSPIYKRTKPQHGTPKPVVKAFSTLAHYLFCKFGVTAAFLAFANADVVIGNEETITPEKYDPSIWDICASTQIKPGPLGKVAYTGSTIRLAIKKSEWNPISAGMVAGFFYIVDFFPQRVTPEDVDDTRLWRTLLGHIIIATTESEGAIVNAVDAHMVTLETYVDVLAAEDLASDGVVVNDFYHLVAELIHSFPRRILEASGTVSSMYDRQLRILRYVCLDIVKDIFNCVFEMRKKYKPGMSPDEVVKSFFNRHFKTDRFMRITYGHGEVRPISAATDNPLFGITSNIIPQTSSSSVAVGRKSTTLDPSSVLDASLAEVGAHLNLPKSEPSGRSRINPYAAIDAFGVILRKQHMKERIDKAQDIVRRF